MNEVSLGLSVVIGVAALLGAAPMFLLFVDYRKRKEIHKPFIYLAVFGFTIAFVLPFLLKAFGIWLALLAPVVVLAYALLARRPK